VTTSAPVFSLFRFRVSFTQGTGTSAAPGAPSSGAGFSEVAGLEASVDVKAYPEGGYVVRQLPGRSTFTNLVLKRGFSADLSFWSWFTDVASGTRPVRRRGVMVELMSNDYATVVGRWTVDRALPVRMKLSDLNARSSELAIEELHLAHEGITIDTSLGGG
jgi:phage tail-like protein